jgi:multidrug resistance protein, MATE family
LEFGTSHRSQPDSFISSSPIAEASVARDLREGPDHDSQAVSQNGPGEDDDSEVSAVPPDYSMDTSYSQSSFVASAARAAVGPPAVTLESGRPTKQERETALTEGLDLQRNNHYMAPERPRKDRGSSGTLRERLSTRLSTTSTDPGGIGDWDEESAVSLTEEGFEASEITTLLNDRQQPYGSEGRPEYIAKRWEEAVASGKVQTEWQQEARVLARYSRSLILTFMLQYSLTVASIFSVGHIGKIELGAVSLAGMTANITGYAVYQGLATSLDTLCAQAYGSGNKTLVGLQVQRMVYFLWVITIPIGMVWLAGTQILEMIVPEKKTAALAGLYLKIILAGAPGLAAFESGKRFVQAQGLFSATLYVLLFCAPFNAFLNWLFVWVSACYCSSSTPILIAHQHFGWGFIGAPIAVASTANLMPICLFLYVRFVDGSQCWGGFSKKALSNWGPMVRLAIPGLLMVLAEYLAFEILTLAASWISSTHLAAQSVLTTLSILTCQVAFPMSIAASTRIANLIGGTLSDSAKTTAKVTLVAACFIGAFNVLMLSSLRNHLPWLFTNDVDVADLVGKVLPVCAVCQLFDALTSNCNGILRGLGKQKIGGWIALFSYYAVAIPISFGTGFGLHWDLYGLWAVSNKLGLSSLSHA